MVRAVNTVRDSEMGILKTSKKFGVPRAILEDYMNSRGARKQKLWWQ